MRIVTSLLAIVALSLVFQNCSPSFDVKELESVHVQTLSEYRKLFNYPYDQAPTFYGEVQLVSNSASAKFNDITYIGIVGHNEGANKTYIYDLSVTNESNFPVCPTLSGQLMSGRTSVIGSCISNVSSNKVKITFKVTVDGETKVFEKSY